MANKITDTRHYQDIADAIREKGGSGTYTPADMPQAILDLPSGGMDEGLKSMIEGSATGEVTLNLPKLSRGVGFILDYFNKGLTSLTIAGCRELGYKDQTFGGLMISYKLTHLEQIYLPDCDSLAFATILSDGGALGSLKKFIAPKLTTMSTSGKQFKSSPNLEEVIMPRYGAGIPATILGSMFRDCSALITADVGAAWQIGNNAFSGCAALTALVLRASSKVLLLDTNVFTNTPIASGTGYVYVPRALISTYESATNWSTYAGQYRAIEDYTSDGTITGEFVHP